MTQTYTHGTQDTVEWFKKAKPEPSAKDLSTQIGVHFEEVAEMAAALKSEDPAVASYIQDATTFLNNLAEYLKATENPVIIPDRVELLDSLCDQVVTAVGVAVCAGMDFTGALNEVNRSNFSKFDSEGNPILDINRKIIKGNDYSKPNLTSFVG